MLFYRRRVHTTLLLQAEKNGQKGQPADSVEAAVAVWVICHTVWPVNSQICYLPGVRLPLWVNQLPLDHLQVLQ